ncbi:MAG: hypothetical protein Q7S03_02065 [bacterium]|nr:hypothetical protein [bacterium]
MKKLITLSSTLIIAFLAVVTTVSAQQIDIAPKSGAFDQLLELSIPGIISGIISLILIAAALIFFFMLVIGGIRWMLSGGDKAGTEGARSQVTAALIGLIIVFSAWAIIKLVNVLFGIDILHLTIPTF